MSNLSAAARTALGIVHGRVAERLEALHTEAVTQGTAGSLIAAQALDEVLKIIDDEMTKLQP